MATCTIFKKFAEPIDNRSLLLIIKDIKSDKYKTQIQKIRALVSDDMSIETKEQIDKLKKKLLAFTPSGTFNHTRNTDALEQYSGFIHLDYDGVEENNLYSVKEKLKSCPYTFAFFISPKGRGIKVFIEVNTSEEHHATAYAQVEAYYNNLLGIPSDPKCKDIPRLCFVSYDPDAFINIKHQKFEINTNQSIDFQNESKNEVIKSSTKAEVNIPPYTEDENLNFHFQKLIEFTNNKETYHEGNRNNYIYLLASNCNRSGLSQSDTENLCINNFDLNENEIKTSVESAYKHHKFENKKFSAKTLITHSLKTSDDKNMPTLPDEIFETIPEFLKKAVSITSSNEERDIILISSIVTMSVAFPKLKGIYADNPVNANLFLFVVAKASAGKGLMVHCKKIVEKIHKELLSNSKIQKEQYELDLAAYNASKKNDTRLQIPEKPVQKILFIPANNSSTGFFELLNNNNGQGIIFETEGDTLTKSFKSDYGDFSDGLRNAFHHESTSYFRRTDKEYVEIKRPQLSVILSGTPKQVPSLIPSAENGLFSRFIFYSMNMKNEWKNVFKTKTDNGLDKYFENLGNEFYDLYNSLLMQREIKFSLTIKQQDEFNDFFKDIQKYYAAVQEEDIISTIRRLGLIAFRMMMIFSALRIMEHGDCSENLVCSDTDFNNTIEMIKILVIHSSYIFTQIGVNQPLSNKENRKEKLFKNLPAHFNKSISAEVAESLGIPVKTLERYLAEFIKSELILHPAKDKYIIPSKEEKIKKTRD